MNISILLYTHSQYKDIWPIFFGQIEKHFSDTKIIVFVDKKTDQEKSTYQYIYYDDNLQYTQRVYNCLNQIKEEVVLFMHEDMILYSDVKINILNEFKQLIKIDKVDFIKLIKAGFNFIKASDIHENLIYCPPDNMFSIQPTICKTKKMKDIFENTNCSIWDFEKIVSEICFKKKYTKCFMSSVEQEAKRGLYHYDSNIFPYIATAIVKGKWNYSEYKNELDILFDMYKINKMERGVF
jgi:hypothetical protein